MLRPEDYVLLAPGLMLGRLSVEPWLALFGIIVGVTLPRLWLAFGVSVLVGIAWGLIFDPLSKESSARMIESAYLAALPITVFALAAYATKRIVRAARS